MLRGRKGKREESKGIDGENQREETETNRGEETKKGTEKKINKPRQK